jgi:hypothetical protein
MAQAGLITQAASTSLRESSGLGADEHIGSEFLGSKGPKGPKSKAKKIKELNKKLMKLHGGRPMQGLPYFPMQPTAIHQNPFVPGVYPGVPGVYNQVYQGSVPTHSHSKQHSEPKKQPSKTLEELKQELVVKCGHYKAMILSEKRRLNESFDSIDTGIKEKAKMALKLAMDLLESSSSYSTQGAAFDHAIHVINSDLLEYNINIMPIKHEHVKAPDFTNIPPNYMKTWGCGYLIKEIVNIVTKEIKVHFKGPEIKTKYYFYHLKAAAAQLRHGRAEVQSLLDKINHLKAPVANAQTTKQRTTFAGNVITVGSEFDSESHSGTISMSNPYNL